MYETTIPDTRQQAEQNCVISRKGKQGHPRNLHTYCLQEVYKPQRKEREPKQNLADLLS